MTALHRANQKQLPIFFAGAGLPLIPRLAGEAKSYAERISRIIRLAAWSARTQSWR